MSFRAESLLPPIQFTFHGGRELRKPAGAEVAWRSLPFADIMYLVSGSYVVERIGERPLTLKAGEAVLITADVRHRLLAPPQGGGVVVLYGHVNYNAWGTLDVLKQFPPVTTFDQPSSATLEPGLRRLAAFSAGDAATHDLATLARLYETGFQMLSLLLAGDESLQIRLDEFFAGMERVVPALRFVRDHLREPISRTTLARSANLSSTRFHYVFKEIMGIAPMEYVNLQRLRRAKMELIGSDRSIAEIAYDCGFQDPYYFSRHFRAREGVSPSDYRTVVRKNQETKLHQ